MNEVENTARILRGEEPMVTSFWCRFGIHKWTKWSDPDFDGSAWKYKQVRKCIHCNTPQWRTGERPT